MQKSVCRWQLFDMQSFPFGHIFSNSLMMVLSKLKMKAWLLLTACLWLVSPVKKLANLIDFNMMNRSDQNANEKGIASAPSLLPSKKWCLQLGLLMIHDVHWAESSSRLHKNVSETWSHCSFTGQHNWPCIFTNARTKQQLPSSLSALMSLQQLTLHGNCCVLCNWKLPWNGPCFPKFQGANKTMKNHFEAHLIVWIPCGLQWVVTGVMFC